MSLRFLRSDAVRFVARMLRVPIAVHQSYFKRP
jgi:hypothetical protein